MNSPRRTAMRDAFPMCSARKGGAGDLLGGDARSIKADQLPVVGSARYSKRFRQPLPTRASFEVLGWGSRGAPHCRSIERRCRQLERYGLQRPPSRFQERSRRLELHPTSNEARLRGLHDGEHAIRWHRVCDAAEDALQNERRPALRLYDAPNRWAVGKAVLHVPVETRPVRFASYT